MQLEQVRFFNGGYCWQSVYLSGVRSLAVRKFFAVFISFRHPRHGRCLIDTGYGPDLFPATAHFPARWLRWFTPIPAEQPFGQPGYLETQGLEQNTAYTIFLSHFHADHIGGTRLFPNARFVARRDGLEPWLSRTPRQQVEGGFISGLLPENFSDRVDWLSSEQFQEDGRLGSLPVFDYWGDGSLLLVDLPGHMEGHIGFLINAVDGPILYAVDAFWDYRALHRQERLPWLSRFFVSDEAAYDQTQRQLVALETESGWTPLACHCPRTQQYV